jgi:hypothetical protein
MYESTPRFMVGPVGNFLLDFKIVNLNLSIP